MITMMMTMRGANTVEDSNPACVEARMTERILFPFIKKSPNSNQTGIPVQFNIALNQEGIELPIRPVLPVRGDH
jgi:hypothetical protein